MQALEVLEKHDVWLGFQRVYERRAARQWI